MSFCLSLAIMFLSCFIPFSTTSIFPLMPSISMERLKVWFRFHAPSPRRAAAMIEMIIRSILHARCVYNYSANDPNGIDRDNYFHYLLPLKYLFDCPGLLFRGCQDIILGVLFTRSAVSSVCNCSC